MNQRIPVARRANGLSVYTQTTDQAKPLWPVAKAAAWARTIVSELRQFCTRIEIAGSIRRVRSHVHDIDLVVEPKPGELEDLWQRCLRSSEPIKCGDQARTFVLDNGLHVDLWIARPMHSDLLDTTPGNWGSLFLCKTGSTGHNINLVNRAKDLGLRWQPHEGVFNHRGELLASETEEQIFDTLQLDFVNPEEREV